MNGSEIVQWITAVAAVIAAAASLFGAYDAWQRRRQGPEPRVSLQVNREPGDGWYRAVLTVENRSDIPLLCREIWIVDPPGTRIAEGERQRVNAAATGFVIEYGEPVDRLLLNAQVAKRGKPADHGSRPLRLFPPASYSPETNDLTARVSLEWIDQTRREMTITVNVPAANRGAKRTS